MGNVMWKPRKETLERIKTINGKMKNAKVHLCRKRKNLSDHLTVVVQSVSKVELETIQHVCILSYFPDVRVINQSGEKLMYFKVPNWLRK